MGLSDKYLLGPVFLKLELYVEPGELVGAVLEMVEGQHLSLEEGSVTDLDLDGLLFLCFFVCDIGSR